MFLRKVIISICEIYFHITSLPPLDLPHWMSFSSRCWLVYMNIIFKATCTSDILYSEASWYVLGTTVLIISRSICYVRRIFSYFPLHTFGSVAVEKTFKRPWVMLCFILQFHTMKCTLYTLLCAWPFTAPDKLSLSSWKLMLCVFLMQLVLKVHIYPAFCLTAG